MSRPQLLKDERGAGAAEFALVLPLLLALLFGIIDAARLAWDYNRLAKATQMGACFAVVTDVLDSGLASASYLDPDVAGVTLTQGDRIPVGALGTLQCTEDGCECTVEPCPPTDEFNADVFARLVTRMQAMQPDITPANVRVTYSGSGLGYAGDPTGMDIAPTVTVSAVNMTFSPLTTLSFAAIPLPDFRTSLTTEDGAGVQSN